MTTALPLQSGGDLARETYWQIGPVQKVVFYFLATLTVLVAAIGIYGRFARYTEGTDDWFDRLDDLPGRDRKSTRLNSSHRSLSRMPSSA